MRSLIPLTVGFLLTTIIGGAFGSWLQRRSWTHQRTVVLADKELRASAKVSQQLSGLMDKRLYRMLRLYYALRSADDSESAREIVQARLQDYNGVLYEWNDRLNMNLALVGTYFGRSAQDWFQVEIYERCQTAGAELETMYRHFVEHEPTADDQANIELHLNLLNDRIYRLGMFMMTQQRGGDVGRTAPHAVKRADSPQNVDGAAVTLWGIKSDDEKAKGQKRLPAERATG